MKTRASLDLVPPHNIKLRADNGLEGTVSIGVSHYNHLMFFERYKTQLYDRFHFVSQGLEQAPDLRMLLGSEAENR